MIVEVNYVIHEKRRHSVKKHIPEDKRSKVEKEVVVLP